MFAEQAACLSEHSRAAVYKTSSTRIISS